MCDGRDCFGGPCGCDALRLLGPPRRARESHLFGAAKANPFPHLADVTADLASRDAFTAAGRSGTAADGHCDKIVKAAIDDYRNLLRLDLGSYPQAGKAIDPSPNGPLGEALDQLNHRACHLEIPFPSPR